MIDVAKIPGVWVRPGRPAQLLHLPGFAHAQYLPPHPPRRVHLRQGGGASWQYINGDWSKSGEWKLVEGQFLSVVEVSSKPTAQARGLPATRRNFQIISIDDHQMVVRPLDPTYSEQSERAWERVEGNAK
jgi:hypothetical protein